MLTQAFAEVGFDLGNWPTVVYLDYVNNSDPANNNTGWAIGTRVGQSKDRGDIQFSYYYTNLIK